MKLALLSKTGGDPEIEIVIGNAQAGRYQVALWNEKTRKWVQVGAGANWDDVADKFTIGKLRDLDNRMLNWDLVILPMSSGPNEFYSATVTITQGTTVVTGGSYRYAGTFDSGAKMIIDMLHLVVK